MTSKTLCIAAFAIAIVHMASPTQAQLPTMSDVDRSAPAPIAGPLPQWDVATVKPHSATDGNMFWGSTADGLSFAGVPLQQMICSAWNLKTYQISGAASWMESTPFDLTAKVSGDDVPIYKKLNSAQRGQMLRILLAERFQLKSHMVTKTLPVYNLVVDKGGPKLTPTTAIQPPSEEEYKANPGKYKIRGGMSMGSGMFKGTGIPVSSLASQLSNALGRPVIDATHLTGEYDINLRYRPEEGAAADNADTPSIFAAVQEQLGLKLVPDKGPVETLVVDSAQKPEAN